MCIGAGGLIWLKIVQDPEPVARRLAGGEYALLVLLFLVAASGLILTAFRGTSAMGMLLAAHIGLCDRAVPGSALIPNPCTGCAARSPCCATR